MAKQWHEVNDEDNMYTYPTKDGVLVIVTWHVRYKWFARIAGFSNQNGFLFETGPIGPYPGEDYLLSVISELLEY